MNGADSACACIERVDIGVVDSCPKGNVKVSAISFDQDGVNEGQNYYVICHIQCFSCVSCEVDNTISISVTGTLVD